MIALEAEGKMDEGSVFPRAHSKFAPMGQRPLCRVTPLGRVDASDVAAGAACATRERATQRPGEPAGTTQAEQSEDQRARDERSAG